MNQRAPVVAEGFLKYLTQEDLRLLTEKVFSKRYASGQTILNEGDFVPGIFVIRHGRVRIEKSAAGYYAAIAELGASEIFGEISFIDSLPASASVVALEDLEVELIERDRVHALMDSVPGLATRLYHSLAVTVCARLRSTTKNLAGI